ncbi:MAG: hypothetical protein JWP89_4379 [Schlesneria sp.]|nr:hypothetical protein [Schlesneria sp.]
MSRGDALGLVYFCANVHATCLTPFIRCGFGLEHPGIYGFWSGALILGIAALDMTGVTFMYFCVWLSALVYRRIETLRLVRKMVVHSRYPGYPWLAMKVPFVRKLSTATALIELELCPLVGLLFVPVSSHLALLVMTCSVSLMVRDGIESEIVRRRLQLMRDAHIEQEYYSRRFRNPFEE